MSRARDCERAYPRTRRRSSGWSDWWIADMLGTMIPGIGGFEKLKTDAKRKASDAAIEYNKRLLSGNLHKATRSEVIPSCERKISV